MYKSKFLAVCLFLFLCTIIVSAEDCWELQDDECFFMDMSECPNSGYYYKDFTDCEILLNHRPEETKNFIQTFVENNFENYEPNSIVKRIYNLNNLTIVGYILLILLLLWIIKNGS